MKNYNNKIPKQQSGFSLAEVIVALTIAAMILVVLMAIYNRVRNTAVAITKKLQDGQMPAEILQRIAEDLDRLAGPAADTTITIENKIDQGYQTARLTISNQIYNDKNKPQTFEKVVWQTYFSPEDDSLVLYRSHSGMAPEDKLLGKQSAEWEDREVFIPLCSGVTVFTIQATKGGDDLEDNWRSKDLPKAIFVTISFAPPQKDIAGKLNVPEEAKTSRTIVIDRTRKLSFQIPKTKTEQSSKQDRKTKDAE